MGVETSFGPTQWESNLHLRERRSPFSRMKTMYIRKKIEGIPYKHQLNPMRKLRHRAANKVDNWTSFGKKTRRP
ncbi:hypothetical protein Ddc_09569 [Ditylenchus destructor]|nr:hypothetical protein Ddc_09569 [Ditylenchus destructor]